MNVNVKREVNRLIFEECNFEQRPFVLAPFSSITCSGARYGKLDSVTIDFRNIFVRDANMLMHSVYWMK